MRKLVRQIMKTTRDPEAIKLAVIDELGSDEDGDEGGLMSHDIDALERLIRAELNRKD